MIFGPFSSFSWERRRADTQETLRHMQQWRQISPHATNEANSIHKLINGRESLLSRALETRVFVVRIIRPSRMRSMHPKSVEIYEGIWVAYRSRHESCSLIELPTAGCGVWMGRISLHMYPFGIKGAVGRDISSLSYFCLEK
jgi:hypothetical protein